MNASTFGLKRCHYVTGEGTERQLDPDSRSAEGCAHLHRAHPSLSRRLGGVPMIVLLVSLAVLIMQLAEQVTDCPRRACRHSRQGRAVMSGQARSPLR
ncbi:hypothetical protein [Streptomyces clavifer]|uniref:hypothetical protein n=1 Tax=Streptomyces clavifer TaxID=68188 RepID=UPI00364AB29A